MKQTMEQLILSRTDESRVSERSVLPIPRLAATALSDANFLHNYAFPGKPLIITGLLDVISGGTELNLAYYKVLSSRLLRPPLTDF